MSEKLPVVSGKDLVKVLVKIGYFVRGRESSHLHLRHPLRPPLTIPDHREIAKGTLLQIMKTAGIHRKQLTELI